MDNDQVYKQVEAALKEALFKYIGAPATPESLKMMNATVTALLEKNELTKHIEFEVVVDPVDSSAFSFTFIPKDDVGFDVLNQMFGGDDGSDD